MANRRKKYTVTVVNPRKRKRPAKKRAKRTPKKKPTRKNPKMAKRKRPTRRRRPAARRAAPRRRRAPSRRRSRANPTRRKRAASYVRGKMAIDPMGPWDGMLARVAGKIFSVWTVKRWGDALTQPTSGQTGGAWTFKNYLIALATGYFGGELAARMINKKTGADFYQGSADFIVTKLTWSEVVMRWGFTSTQLGGVSDGYPSFGGVSDGYPAFGNAEVQALMAQGQPGDMIDDGQGNRLLNQGGRWVSMMGSDIVEAGPLGSAVVEAGPLGGVVEAGPLGHMMSQSATRADDRQGSYTFRGSKDPYRAAFM